MISDHIDQQWLHIWRSDPDLTAILGFNGKSLIRLREAISTFLLANIDALSRKQNDILDEMYLLRMKVLIASNPETPAAVLEYLARHSSESVLERVAEHAHVPTHILEALSSHPASAVRLAVADNENTPASILEKLAADCDPDVRHRLAENPNLPPQLLERLRNDQNPYVADRAEKTLRKTLMGEVLQGRFRRLKPGEERLASG